MLKRRVLSSILRLRRNNDDDDDDDNGLTCAVDSKSDHASMGGMKVVNVSQHASTTPDCVIFLIARRMYLQPPSSLLLYMGRSVAGTWGDQSYL